MGLGKCVWCLLKWTLIIGVLVLAIQYWLDTKKYVFTPDEIALIAGKYKGKNPEDVYPKIYKELEKKYPGHILPEHDLQWIFVNAGGWMGSICLVHASLTEYVLFFGTALETSGHSGRYWANVSDTVLVGEFHQWQEGELDKRVYKSGDTILHAWGEAAAVNFKAGTWMVEYGRGFIPSTMGFALADTFTSTHDFFSFFYTLRVYAKALFMELSHCLSCLSNFVSSHV